METFFKSLVEPASYIYLSGIFLIIFGAMIGIAPPDSRKNLNTSLAIPIFILLGLINIFRSFVFLTPISSLIKVNAIFQSVVIILCIELGRRNLENAYSKKKFSLWWYIPIALVLTFLSYKYDYTRRIIRRIIILLAKLFAIIVTLKATKILPPDDKLWVRSSFFIAFIGSIIQFIIDLNFAKVIDGRYELLQPNAIFLFYSETIAALVISVVILTRRYKYEKSQRLHIPNLLSLISPSVVFITSIIIAIGVLIATNTLLNNSARVWLLYLSMIIISILYLIMYGYTYNSENIKNLETAQTNFQLVFQHTPDPICVINESDSTILSVNKSMQICFGYNESLIGKKLDDMIISNNRFHYHIPITNDVVISECQFKKANGTVFTAEVTSSFIDYLSKEALLLNIHDISIFKEIEEKLIEANQTKSWLLSNASHELRTPMTAIIGLSELAVSICNDEKQKEVVELLRISSKSLMSLINDMFDLAEIENGKIKVNKSTFNLKDLINEVTEYISFFAKRKNKNVIFKVSDTLPSYINSDLEHLRPTLMAIIDYASNICVNNNTLVNIDLEKNNNDNGNFTVTISGINKEHIDEIKKGIDNSVDYSNPYLSGLNRRFASRLSLYTLIINSLNGSIKIDEKERIPETLSLTIEIPVEIINKEISNDTSLSEGQFFYTNGKQLNILVADDNDVNIFLIESIITRFKGAFKSVKNGLEAIEAVKKDSFDCILLDIQMPKMNGFQTLKEIREMSDVNISNIPIIAISAFASNEEKNKIINAGAQKYLGKPFYPNDLYQAISSIFQLDKKLPENIKVNEPNKTTNENTENISVNVTSNSDDEIALAGKLKRIDYKDFKLRISPNSKTITKLDEIYNKRYMSLDIEVDNCINNSDSSKLRETAHSIKGLVGMMASKESWEIARNIEKKASEGDFDGAISRIGELRMHLAEIADDLKIIKEYYTISDHCL